MLLCVWRARNATPYELVPAVDAEVAATAFGGAGTSPRRQPPAAGAGESRSTA